MVSCFTEAYSTKEIHEGMPQTRFELFSLSEVIVFGTPKREIQSLRRTEAQDSAAALTNQNCLGPESQVQGRPSVELYHSFERLLVVMTGTGPASMFGFMLGHTYCSNTGQREALTPGWDKEWSWSKTAWSIVKGTEAWVRPWEMSDRRVRPEYRIGSCASCNEVGEVQSFRSSSSRSGAEAKASRLIEDCSRARALRDSASATGLAWPVMWQKIFVFFCPIRVKYALESFRVF